MEQLKPVAWLVLLIGFFVLIYGVYQYYDNRPVSLIERADRLVKMGEPKSFADASLALSEGLGAARDALVGPIYLKRAQALIIWGVIVVVGGIVFVVCTYRPTNRQSGNSGYYTIAGR